MIPVRKEILSLPPYVPAKSIDSVKREYGIKNVIKLAGNENTLGFSQNAARSFENITSYYPDPDGLELRETLAGRLGIPIEKIVLGNGSFELISLIGQIFLEPGTQAVMAVPSFGWYINATLLSGAELVKVPLEDFKVDLDAVLGAVTDRTRVIWLTNPNNPTGTIFTEDELVSFLNRLPDSVAVVLDEAYIEFVCEEGFPDSVKLLEKYKNIILLRTFSKVYGLAGLRIGYAIADEEIISYFNRVRLPLNVNMAAQLAAAASLSDEAFRQSVIENARRGREQFYRKLDEWGFYYVPSNTNFILFRTGPESEKIVQSFLEKGILIRGGSEFGYPDMLRITIGTQQENEKVLDLLYEIAVKDKEKE